MIEGGGRKFCNFQIMTFDNNNYNKKLQSNANKLRKEMTKAEACLWKYVLKAKQLNGYQFRRQRPVINYIVDFVCLELKLVIEVDGLTHHWEETMVKDQKKQSDLEAAGFTVLRFTDEEVLDSIAVVHECIQNWIDDRIKGGSKSTPT
jgi:very-short-patch-repair endonuclease